MNIQDINISDIINIKDSKISKNIPKNSTDEIGFKEMLNNAINDVNNDQIQAEKMNNLLAIGEIDNLHDVTIAAQKAELTLNLAVEIRNKLADAYSEIMRIQF